MSDVDELPITKPDRLPRAEEALPHTKTTLSDLMGKAHLLVGLSKIVAPGHNPVGAAMPREVATKLNAPKFPAPGWSPPPARLLGLHDLTQPNLRSKIQSLLKNATRSEAREAETHRFARNFGLKLSYDPVNLEVYATAYSGAMNGQVGGRTPSSASPSQYVSQALTAIVWAQTFDTIWDSDAAIDEVQAESIFLGSFGVWLGRGPQPSPTPAQFTPTIVALIASIEESEIQLAAQGITPATWMSGGGGGGSVATTVITGAENVVTTAFGVYLADTTSGNVTLSVPAPVNNQFLAPRVAKGAGTITLNFTGAGNGANYGGALQTQIILGNNPTWPPSWYGNASLGYYS